MGAVLLRSGCYVAIIVLGFLLRRWNLLRQEDVGVLSVLVLKVTLPAAVIVNFADKELAPSLLSVAALGFVCALANMLLGWWAHRRDSKDEKAFYLLNYSSYNIGNFTLPFVQSFLGPAGAVVTSLFDTGNAVVCMGGAAAVAKAVKSGEKLSLRRVLSAMCRAVPLITCVVMTALSLLHLSLPKPVLELAQIVGGANVFLSMLMIGVGLRLSGERTQMRDLARFLVGRYALAVVLALLCWFFLPFDIVVRRTMVVLVFAPVAGANLPFTRELEGDVGMSGAMNSASVICSIPIIVALLTWMA